MRFVAVTILGILLAVCLWNYLGAVSLRDIDSTYVGTISEGSLAGLAVNADGVRLVKDWVESETRPSIDPTKIVAHQLWYNAITKGYELKMWIAPEEFRSGAEQYAIYQHGNKIILRIEYRRRNRFLVASFTPQELEEALLPYVIK